MLLSTTLRCGLSGLEIGKLEVITTIGALPYLSHWDKMQVRHPVFSLSPLKLFQFTKKEWDRLAKSAADEEISPREIAILQVSWLACLHSFGRIKQDKPMLPPLHVVQSTLSKVLALAYWRYTLDSQRFKFPEYHISQENDNLDFKNIQNYLELCFLAKDSYATRIDDLREAARNKAAEEALKALSREWVTPVSNKVLWQWVRSQLSAELQCEAEGWLGTIFLGKSSTIIDFDEDEIELFEEIVISACEAGTGIMQAVRDRIAKIWSMWKTHHRAFEIDLVDFAINNGLLVNGEQVAYPDPGPEPQIGDFKESKGKYFQAHAKWTIAKKAWDSQQTARQQTPSQADEEADPMEAI